MWATKLMDLAQWTESHPIKPSNGMSFVEDCLVLVCKLIL